MTNLMYTPNGVEPGKQKRRFRYKYLRDVGILTTYALPNSAESFITQEPKLLDPVRDCIRRYSYGRRTKFYLCYFQHLTLQV